MGTPLPRLFTLQDKIRGQEKSYHIVDQLLRKMAGPDAAGPITTRVPMPGNIPCLLVFTPIFVVLGKDFFTGVIDNLGPILQRIIDKTDNSTWHP
jgi:hypothetical protein